MGASMTFDVCTYNAGNATKDRVERDLSRLARRYQVVGLQEVADQKRAMNATGAQVLTGEGNGEGKVALLVAPGVPIAATGYVPCTKRSRVGSWGAGPAVTDAKGIRWATVVLDDAPVTIGSTHLVSSVQRPARGPLARAGRARRLALYRKHIAGIVAWVESVEGPLVIVGDFNAVPDFELLDPLRAVGLSCASAPSHGKRDIDHLWSRGLDPVAAADALDGYSSDHKPVTTTYEHQGAPVPTRKGFMPGAIDMNIPPGANDPSIKPVGGVLHVAVSESSSLRDFFAHRSGGVESHFYVRRDGSIEQYRSIYFEADANLDGNSFERGGVRCGLVSVETQGMGPGEWTTAQLDAMKRIILWCNAEAGVTVDVIKRWDGDGWGYHTMWGSPSHWTPSVKTCPGPDRIKQFDAVIAPWLNAGGKDPAPKPTLVQQARDNLTKALARAEAKGQTARAAMIRAALAALGGKQ